MKTKNIFNRGLGFSGQLGKLGNVIENIFSALDGKVDKVSNKGLSANDFTDDMFYDFEALKSLATVTVTYNSEGGSSVSTETISFGAHPTEPTPPTKSGYDFEYWYEIDEPMGDQLIWEQETFAKPLKRNVTLHASWSETLEESTGGES